MLHHGLYEQVINNALTSELAEIPEARKAVTPIDKAEASKVLTQYLYDVVQKCLGNVLENDGKIFVQITLTNQSVNPTKFLEKFLLHSACGCNTTISIA